MEKRAFRGQHGLTEAKIHTKLPSITFCSYESAKLYATHPNKREDKVVKPIVLSATIQINNPIINNESDCFADFDVLVEKLGADFMWSMAEKYEGDICSTNNWMENYSEYSRIKELKEANPEEIVNLYMDAYVLLDDEEFVAQSIKFGFDGAIHMGNGETHDELEYRVFSLEQITNIEEIK